jgi:hypothetical protein
MSSQTQQARKLQQEKREQERFARWEANQKVRAEEKARQEEFKANCWAAKITKTVSPAAIAKMAEDEQRIKAEQIAKAAKIAEKKRADAVKRREEYERNYEPNMQRKYGLKKPFVIPAISSWHDEEVFPIGSFWEFKVSTRDDSEFAKSRRRNPENQRKFHAYLAEEYGRNWLEATEDSADDCAYLCEKRREERWEREQEEYEREERQREELEEMYREMEEKEAEKEEMERKLRSGEISKKAYYEWECARDEEEWEEQEAYHTSGLQIWDSIERISIAERARLARKAEREK